MVATSNNTKKTKQKIYKQDCEPPPTKIFTWKLLYASICNSTLAQNLSDSNATKELHLKKRNLFEFHFLENTQPSLCSNSSSYSNLRFSFIFPANSEIKENKKNKKRKWNSEIISIQFRVSWQPNTSSTEDKFTDLESYCDRCSTNHHCWPVCSPPLCYRCRFHHQSRARSSPKPLQNYRTGSDGSPATPPSTPTSSPARPGPSGPDPDPQKYLTFLIFVITEIPYLIEELRPEACLDTSTPKTRSDDCSEGESYSLFSGIVD